MSSEHSIFDIAAEAAIHAREENVDRAQVSNLLSALEGLRAQFANDQDVLRALQVFIARQARVSKREIGIRTASALIQGLSKCSNVEEARRFLGLFKWMYESLERIPIRVRQGRGYERYNRILQEYLLRRR